MYNIYTTEAFVVGVCDFSESSRWFYALTRDFGLLTLHCQGIRELNSKLRTNLSSPDHVFVSLVKGRLAWRVTGSWRSEDFRDVFYDPQKAGLIARIFLIIRRLVVGQTEDVSLFEELKEAFWFIERTTLSDKELANCEIILVSRILRCLGYWPARQSPVFSWSREVVSDLKDKGKIVFLINRSLASSQL